MPMDPETEALFWRCYAELMEENICRRCDDTMPDGATTCPHCGAGQRRRGSAGGAAARARGIITIRTNRT